MVHPDSQGAAVLELVAMAFHGYRKVLCCCAWKGVQGVRWLGVLVVEAVELMNCVSCQCCLHCLAVRDLARKVSACEEALGEKPGYYQCHLGAGCWWQAQEAVVQLISSQEPAVTASQRGFLNSLLFPQVEAWGRPLGRGPPLAVREMNWNYSCYCPWISQGQVRSGH